MRKQHRAILFVLIALGAGTLWLHLGRKPIEEGRCRLTYEKAEPPGELSSLAWQVLEAQTIPLEGIRDLPTGFDRPCYYQIRSAGRRIPLVANLSEPFRLCIDTNGDGVLSRQRCWEATFVHAKHGTGSTWRFGPISLVGPDNASEGESGFYVDCYGPDAGVPLVVRPASFRTGKLRLGGRTYRAALVDGDCDGRFRPILSLPADRQWWLPGADVLAVDLNRNGEFERSWLLSAPSEVVPLGRLLRVADTYYAIDVALDGTSLALSRTEPPLGTLVLEPNDVTAQIRLWSDAAAQYLRGRQWQLPAGKYLGTYLAFEKTDAAGDVWSFSCDLNSGSPDYPLGALKPFVIAPGRTTQLRIGPPFVVTTDVRRFGRDISLNTVLFGCGSERYQTGVQRNGRPVPEPTFKIVDEKGNLLMTGKFQYG